MLKHELIDILSHIMSSNNDVRQTAENYFIQQQDENLYELITLLLQILRDIDVDLLIRSLSGILLRRIIDSGTVHGVKIDDQSLIIIRNELLDIWVNETNSVILRRLSHVIAQIASNGNWTDLIPTLLSHGGSFSGRPLIALLNLLEILADYCPDDILTHLSNLVSFLGPLMISEDAVTQIACAKTVGACIVSIHDEGALDTFKPALQLIIRNLGNALNRGDELDAVVIMEYLATIAQRQPLFFKGAMDNIVEAMVTVAGSDGLDFPTRSIALELMVTLTETAPALARRCTGLVNGLVPLAMNLMLEIEEDDDEWASQEYTIFQPDESAFVGEEAIERAADRMGRALISPLIKIVQEYSASSDPRCRRAAIAALSRLAEGATEIFKKDYFEMSIPFMAQCLSDSSPRVCFQAIQAIGQLANLYPQYIPVLMENYLDILVDFMGNSSLCERIRGHAVSALINLCSPHEDKENDEAGVLLSPDQLNRLLSQLCAAMESTSINVQPSCILLLGAVAKSNQANFSSYYSLFIPGIKSIMREAGAPHLGVLRGRAMECIGIIGEAVDEEIFAPDALEVMHLLLQAISEGDDITYDYILPACARIAKALRDKFEPFLSYVMTPVLTGANQVLQFSMVDAEDGDVLGEIVYDEDTGIESAVVAFGPGIKKRVSLNTQALRQKTQCAKMIFEYANSLEGYLGDYILPSLEVMLNMVTDKHSSDLRISASQAIAPLFKAVMDNSVRFHQIPTDQVPALLDLVLSKLLETIRGEINSSARESSVEALRDVVEACYESGNQQPDGRYSDWVCAPTLESSMAIISELVLKCHESVQRRAEKEQAIVRNEGLDAEDRETYATELESEEDLLSCLVEVISEFFKIHRNNLMPFVDQNVAPHFAPYLAPSHPKTLQVVSVCLLDDIIEYGGDQACQKYLPHSINTFLKNLKSSHLVLRQCSAYGLAQGLRRAPIICEGYLNSIIPALLDAAMTNSDEEENEGIIENAIFGLGFVLVTPSYRNIVPPQNLHEILNLWLESLPLTADNVESKISLLQFCELLEDSELVHVVLGASLENLPSVIRIIADVFIAYQQAEASGDIKNCIVHPDTMLRVRNIWEQWKQNQQISSCMESFLRNLTPQQQQVLTS